jgi:8-oxo-dGTP pyrophosphatase MutT (NUDIX family)
MLNELPAIRAASVFVLRDDPLEVLLLLRNEKSSFAPSAWVFPGGAVENGESERDAAARETFEETGLPLDPKTLVLTSRWITPVGAPKRFDTDFYLAAIHREAEVRIDGVEIVESMWITPAEALARRDLRLVFPTIKNLEAIVSFDSFDALIESRRGAVIEAIQPVLVDGKPTLR